jgi:hypothetical protein
MLGRGSPGLSHDIRFDQRAKTVGYRRQSVQRSGQRAGELGYLVDDHIGPPVLDCAAEPFEPWGYLESGEGQGEVQGATERGIDFRGSETGVLAAPRNSLST